MRLLSLLTSEAERISTGSRPPRERHSFWSHQLQSEERYALRRNFKKLTVLVRKKKKRKIEHSPIEISKYRDQWHKQQWQNNHTINNNTDGQFYRTVFSPRFALRVICTCGAKRLGFSRQLKGQETKRISGKTATIPTTLKQSLTKKEKKIAMENKN